MEFSFDTDLTSGAVIKVIGVGGGGGNCATKVFLALNLSLQTLMYKLCVVQKQIQ